jgi:hypothetical protein
MHAAGNTDTLLDRDARGQDTRRVNTIYTTSSPTTPSYLLITPASVAASRKVEREQASAAEKGQPKNAHTTASNTTVATTLPFTPSRHQKSHYRHTSQQPPSARRVLSRYVTTLPRSLHYFSDGFLYFLATTARRLQKRVPQTNCFSPLFLYFLVCGAHVAASHRKVTLLKVAPTTLLRKRPLREISHLVVSVLMNDPPILSSCHSCYPLCFPRVCLKSGVSKTFYCLE